MRAFILAALAALCVSCGATTPFVGFGTMGGVGTARSDGNSVLVIGGLTGEFGVFGKVTKQPIYRQFDIGTDQVYIYNGLTGEETLQSVSDPLPAWTRDLFYDGEIERIEYMLGYALTFEE